MPDQLSEFASSANGDRWYYGKDEATGQDFVEHCANLPSGGAVTRTDVAAFLERGPIGPEHEALRRLLDLPLEVKPPSRPTLHLPSESYRSR